MPFTGPCRLPSSEGSMLLEDCQPPPIWIGVEGTVKLNNNPLFVVPVVLVVLVANGVRHVDCVTFCIFFLQTKV